MRWPIKMRIIWAFLSGAVIVTTISLLFLRNTCKQLSSESVAIPRASALIQPDYPLENQSSSCSAIPCIINGDRRRRIECQKVHKDVFIPFTFLEKYFEVTGKVESDKKSPNPEKYFNWQHSYAKLIYPKLPYHPDGIFMSFDNYNVEVRDRVKCISAIEGVPLSSQWTTGNGHFYPIQVAQFGLSHYSKNITEEAPKRTVIADFQKPVEIDVPVGCSAERIEEFDVNSWVLDFSAPESISGSGVSFESFPDTGEPYLIFSVKFRTLGSVTLQLDVQDSKHTTYELIYTCSNNTIWSEGNRIFYGIGSATEWKLLVRDVYVDLVKGLSLGWKKSSKKDKTRPTVGRIRIVKMILHGQGHLDNVTASSTAHSELFDETIRWLLRHQDAAGGWAITVKRKLGEAELQPGWYSAMAQGQAMSTLTRAYRRSGNKEHLTAAIKALDLFKKSSTEKGVSAVFLDKFVWFEEYPTTPSSFVLNGFIYALLGLYDVSVTATGDDQKRAQDLFFDGVASLKALLPLFDTGSGSTYDLRHFTLKTAPNIARWDYHATHITQLLVMNSIHPDPLFEAVTERWVGYMKGERAAHN